MRRALTVGCLLSLALASLVGCKPGQNAQVFKRREHVYRTVVSLSPSTTEILLNVNLIPKLAGRTQFDDYPVSQVKSVPIVAGLKPDYEKLTGVHPDLIVYDEGLYNAEEVAKLKTQGAGLFALNANTLDGYVKQLWELGNLVGGETHVSDYVDRIRIAMNSASAKPPLPTPKVAIIMPSVTGDDMISGTDSFLSNIVTRCGGTPVGPKADRFVKLSPETLVQDNPDVIICNGSKTEFAGAEAMLKDPRLQSVSAIKNKRIKLLDSSVLLRRGGRVDQLIDGVYRAISPPAAP